MNSTVNKRKSRLLILVIVASVTGAGLLMASLRSTSTIDSFLGFRAEKKLSVLPSFGARKASLTVYADYHWPARSGGIASRTLGQNGDAPWKYKLYSESQLSKLSAVELENTLKRLSPAEKYDLARNRFDYPLVKLESERTRALSRTNSDLSLGWVLSSGFFKEPKSVTYSNAKNKFSIPFSSSDIKALMSYYFQVIGIRDWK